MRSICIILFGAHSQPIFAKIEDCGTSEHPPLLWMYKDRFYIRERFEEDRQQQFPSIYSYKEIQVEHLVE